MVTLTKKNVIIAVVMIAALGIFMKPSSIETSVKSGKLDLYCLFEDGERKVSPELIEYRVENYWKFKNGGASNCRAQ